MSRLSVRFRNLTARARKLPPVVGREDELRRLVQMLMKPKHHHIVLVGDPGVGKTSLIGLLAQATGDGALPGLPSTVYELDIAPVLNLLQTGDSTQGCYQAIANNLEQLPNGAIVAVEDIQLLAGDSSLRLEQAVSLLQTIAALTNIKLIVTTTKVAYNQTFGNNYSFTKIFSVLELETLPYDYIVNILQQAIAESNIQADKQSIATVIELADRYSGGRQLPDTGLRLVEDVVAQAIFDGQLCIDSDAIKTCVAQREKIPIESLAKNQLADLTSLNSKLNQRVLGQSAPLKVISQSIVKNAVGFRDESRPRGSFLLLGPSGVGKTETAKALADIVYDSTSAMVRLDMSEYSEAHSTVRLIGSPPGYVGYEEGGQLTGAIHRQPYSLVLLDEIEKAHPKLFDVFLQLLDDGRLTDAKAQTIDCTHTMVLATSNIGSEMIAQASCEGIDTSSTEFINLHLMPLLMQNFRPEFINRFDAILVYQPLDMPQLVELAQRELSKLETKLNSRQIKLEVSATTIDSLLRPGYNPLFGARPVRRLVSKYFEMPIAEQIVNGQLVDGTTINGHETWLPHNP